MLLKNYFNLARDCSFNGLLSKSTYIDAISLLDTKRNDPNAQMQDVNGNVWYPYFANNNDTLNPKFPLWPQKGYAIYLNNNWGPNDQEMSFVLGSGTTPPTENDYTLVSKITSGLSASKYIDVKNNSNGVPCIYYTFGLTNTSSGDITIGEIGLATMLAYGTSSWPKWKKVSDNSDLTSSTPVLLMRSVLDVPITIPAGESATIKPIIQMDAFAPAT